MLSTNFSQTLSLVNPTQRHRNEFMIKWVHSPIRFPTESSNEGQIYIFSCLNDQLLHGYFAFAKVMGSTWKIGECSSVGWTLIASDTNLLLPVLLYPSLRESLTSLMDVLQKVIFLGSHNLCAIVCFERCWREGRWAFLDFGKFLPEIRKVKSWNAVTCGIDRNLVIKRASNI